MTKRDRGAGTVYQPRDPNDRERRLQTWWIDYHVDGHRHRESSKSRRKSDAIALLKRRQGEHATGRFVGAEARRLTFEDLESCLEESYQLAGRRSLGRLRAAFNHLRVPFGGMRAVEITSTRLQTYAVERGREAAPATVQYELALLRRAFTGSAISYLTRFQVGVRRSASSSGEPPGMGTQDRAVRRPHEGSVQG